MSDVYKPIACAIHDEYELAIMQKRLINILWTDDTGKHEAKVKPENILVKNGQEFLLANIGEKEICIRLDKITIVA